MAIFRYTLIKYCKSYSTWIIAIFSMLIVFMIGGFVPFNYAQSDTPKTYATLSVSVVAAITSFLSVFTSVFAGFKGASMFKDEVEDGTFLVILSKPIVRGKIIFFKWLALQTIIIIYTFIVALSFLISILIFDTGKKLEALESLGLKTLSSQIVTISLAVWGILFIVSLIFSSLALLLSTKLSVGTTVGICIALGVMVPITTLVARFTSKPPYTFVNNPDMMRNQVIFDYQLPRMYELLPAQLTSPTTTLGQFAIESKRLEKTLDSNNVKTLSSLGFLLGGSDPFKIGQFFALNYQIQKLSEFASEQVVPENVRDDLNFSGHAAQTFKVVSNAPTENNPFSAKTNEQIKTLNELIISSWYETNDFRIIASKMFYELLKMSIINRPILLSKNIINANFSSIEALDASNKLTPGLLTEQNKYKFFQEIAAPNSLLDWMSKTKDEIKVFSKDEAIRYYQAMDVSKNLMNQIYIDSTILDFSALKALMNMQNIDVGEYIKMLVSRINSFYYPISSWISLNSVEKFMNEFNIKESEYLTYEKNVNLRSDDSLLDSIGTFKEIIRGLDTPVYNKVLSTISAGYDLAKIKTIQYSSKWTILWIYLAIALVLVPISYLVVRKQDFK